jgi:hypothetical protein
MFVLVLVLGADQARGDSPRSCYSRSAATRLSMSSHPSSMVDARASRSSFSIGYSWLRPLPPKIWMAPLAICRADSYAFVSRRWLRCVRIACHERRRGHRAECQLGLGVDVDVDVGVGVGVGVCARAVARAAARSDRHAGYHACRPSECVRLRPAHNALLGAAGEGRHPVHTGSLHVELDSAGPRIAVHGQVPAEPRSPSGSES